MRILGIDYGTKRIGLAISDETRSFARELEILSPKVFWEKINTIIEENEITQIVIGWPLNMKGEMTEKTHEVLKVKAQLSELVGLPVDTMDERLSSVMAKKFPGGKKNVDSLAAQIILQNYLRSKN